MHDLVVRDLEQARNRTLGLTALDDPTLVTQHDPLMSPLVWDLAHVGQQEELWLLRAGGPARPGMPLDETATAPFARGRWLLQNGVADRSVLGPHPDAGSACDSAQLAAHLFGFGPERAGEFVRDLGKRDPDARLNLLRTAGRRIIATRWNDTLSILRTGGGFVVASEPYDDDPGWADVPDHHLVDVADGVVTVTELEA
ncbi:MAG TPA: DinB family protein [Streptosporangiaceae bacterium]|nr:DinB family protein [Streptosporangiaceae bacterium]